MLSAEWHLQKPPLSCELLAIFFTQKKGELAGDLLNIAWNCRPSHWAQHDGRNLLHTVCYVPDLEAAIHFCERLLGLQVLYWGAAVEEHLKPCAVIGKGIIAFIDLLR